MRERGEFGLKGVEEDSEETRYVLILDDNWPAVECWIEYFEGARETRCVAPEIEGGFSEALCRRLDPNKVVMVIVDWFYDERGRPRPECQLIIDWVRKTNEEAFVVESSFAATRGRRIYGGSNISINSFQVMTGVRFQELLDLERGSREDRIYLLQRLIVPELDTARDLDERGHFSQAELVYLFAGLQTTARYYGLLEELGIEDEVLASRVLGMNIDEIGTFLHCAYNYLAQRKLGRDERFYGMALSRMRMMLAR